MAKDDDAQRDDVARDDAERDDAERDEQEPDDPADRTEAYDDEEQLTDEPAETGGGDVSKAALVGGAVGVVLVVLVASFLVWTFLQRDDGAAEGDRASIAEAASTVSTSTSPLPAAEEPEAEAASATPYERCLNAAGALRETLSAAGPALDQWSVHVGAMNKLVVGEITLQQATAFWNDTRIGAHRGVQRFQRSRDALRREGVDCPRPGMLGAGRGTLRPCAQHVDDMVRVVRVARISVNTWASHVHHMDMLRLGTLSPEEATEMWLSMWQQGVRDLETYRVAAGGIEQSHGCHQLG